MGVTIELHTDHHVENFALIEYARIGKTAANSTVELQINPLMSTVLTADLKISDPKLFGYFRLFFKDIQKIPRTGFCLIVYLILQCRLLELQHKRPVEYTLEELRNLLQFDLVRSAVVKKRQVSVGSFNRQTRVALSTVCKSMDWTLNNSGDTYVIEPAPADWYSRAGFFSRNDALFFGCNSTNYCLFDRGVDKTEKDLRAKFWKHLTWLVECTDTGRLNHARALFETSNENFKADVFKSASTGNIVAQRLTVFNE
jgi:tetrahydromethanopterin S-methyltransferase subunit F